MPAAHLPNQSEMRTRLRRLIAEKADGRQQDFAELVSIQASMLSRILAGHDPITRRHLLKIEQATGARLAWLEHGIEPVYYAAGAPERAETDHYEGHRLRDYLDRNGVEYAELARRLGKSKNTIQGYFRTENISQKNKESILTALDATFEEVFAPAAGNAARVSTPSRIRPVTIGEVGRIDIPRIPISARAGFGYQAFFDDANPDREYVPVTDDRLHPGIPADRHVIVEINGDSMEPVLEHGYEVLAYRMPEGQVPPINKIVVVDFRDELTVKRLVGIDYVGNAITLRSENGGAEMRLPMDEIRSVWHVYDYYKARL